MRPRTCTLADPISIPEHYKQTMNVRSCSDRRSAGRSNRKDNGIRPKPQICSVRQHALPHETISERLSSGCSHRSYVLDMMGESSVLSCERPTSRFQDRVQHLMFFSPICVSVKVVESHNANRLSVPHHIGLSRSPTNEHGDRTGRVSI